MNVEGIGNWELVIGNWAILPLSHSPPLLDINSGSQARMISNPRLIVGRKVESSSQQIRSAIFIFLTPPSTVNSQQSTVNNDSGAAGIDMTN
jgi:hypothetical protein